MAEGRHNLGQICRPHSGGQALSRTVQDQSPYPDPGARTLYNRAPGVSMLSPG